MKYGLYSIQDTLIAFNAPYVQVSEEVAKRGYQEVCETNPHSKDLRLFKIGEFDDETGEVKTMIPKQIMGGIEHGKDNI